MNSDSTATAPAPRRPFLPPTITVPLTSDLTLTPRLKLLLTFFRSDPEPKPINQWLLRQSLLDFLLRSLSLPVPDSDLRLRKRPDLHKRKLLDPVAHGALLLRDPPRNDFPRWRDNVIAKLNGIELSLEGVKFRMDVHNPDDFDRVKEEWEEHYSRSVYRGRRPDTVVIQGIPSRWLAEPRVSSKPSMLVTHTVFSVLGSIRNIHVAGDDDIGKKSEDEGEIVSGLHCKVWVQFENYSDFCNAMNILCGRSMQKQGSRLNVDYEVTWDKEGFFQNVQQKRARSPVHDKGREMQAQRGHRKHEVEQYQSRVTRFDSDSARSKRFRD